MTHLLDNLFSDRRMQFAPIQEDDDTLSQSIKDDPVVHDNTWDLHEDLDAQQLDQFWDDALRELGAEAPEEQQ